jgi:hypothetical protein
MRVLKRLAAVMVAVGAIGAAVAALTFRLHRAVEGPPPDLSGSPAAAPPRSARRTPAPIGEARVLGPVKEPSPLQSLAGWVPAPPRSPLTKALAYAWASPMTLAGLLVGLASGARPEVRDGVLLFAEARGPAGAILRARGFAATALGHVVVATRRPTDELMAHELVHVRQAERLGAVFAPVYGLLYLAYGYARHPMERAARLGGRRLAGLDA